MNFIARRRRMLQGIAGLIFVLGLAVWAFTGAHVGWTQTSTVSFQRDEITGIDYPVRRAAFVAGVEVPVAATAVAAALVAASLLPRLRRSPVHV